jgi:hypothetical protein
MSKLPVTVSDLAAKSNRYVSTLGRCNIASTMRDAHHYFTPEGRARVRMRDPDFESNYRIFIATTMIHPVYHALFGKIRNWYKEIDVRKNFFTTGCTGAMFVENFRYQIEFIQKVQRLSPFRIEPPNVERYLRFVQLYKKYQETMSNALVPPFDVRIVWYAHMLDHGEYCARTEEYIGHVLDHDDRMNEEDLLKCTEQTKKLWEENFDQSYECILVSNLVFLPAVLRAKALFEDEAYSSGRNLDYY